MSFDNRNKNTVNFKSLPIAISSALTISTVLGLTSATADDSSTYEELIAYTKEKGIAHDVQPNEYYDPKKESEYHTDVKRETYKKIQFPSQCIMEIVNERHREVAPPTTLNLSNSYDLTEREILEVKLEKVVPSKIYSTGRPNNETVVIIKARKGGIVSKTELYFNQPGNKNLYGLTAKEVAENSIDSPFGKLDCTEQTCTRYRSLNGYGITPSEKQYTDGLRDALISIVRKCGGTG